MNNSKFFQWPNPKSDSFEKNRPNTTIPETPPGILKRLTTFFNNTLNHSPALKRLIDRWIAGKHSGDERIDTLNRVKRENSASRRLQTTLTAILIVMLLVAWRWGLPTLAKIDQLQNDLKEQAQVIHMEKSNQTALTRLTKDQTALAERIQKINQVLSEGDEGSEAVISMFEDMAVHNRVMIDSIGIRALSDSQIFNESFQGTIGIYEYTFGIESDLPNVLSFIASLRSSLRLMDLMAMQIEEKEGVYRANFVVNVYHNLLSSSFGSAQEEKN